MNNDIRFVHREETFNDFAVQELARVRSACICKVQFERCNKSECATCPIGIKYNNTVNQMNDYDQSRLNMYITDAYMHDSYFPMKWMSFKKLQKYYNKICGVIWLIGLLTCLFVVGFEFLVEGF